MTFPGRDENLFETLSPQVFLLMQDVIIFIKQVSEVLAPLLCLEISHDTSWKIRYNIWRIVIMTIKNNIFCYALISMYG